MPKKPSLTKQIADLLGTEDKREQLQKITNLATLTRVPPLAITVLYTATGVNLTYTSPVQVQAQDLKAVLNLAVDDITRAVLKQEMEKQMEEQVLGDGEGLPPGLDPFDGDPPEEPEYPL